MIRPLVFVFLFFCSTAHAQIRLSRLEIKEKEIYTILSTDIMVIDTLIVRDSATIKLNGDKKDNFIHTKVAIFGKGASIVGRGEDGSDGKEGIKGYTQQGPCKDGTRGLGATGGSHGQDGVNLFLYFDKLTVNGTFRIDLSGGNGGDGGKGGEGGGGSSGTRVCVGGSGGNGGNGASGGNGGNGGTLTISCKECQDLRTFMSTRLASRSFGGHYGIGGAGGQGGMSGLGVSGESAQDGKRGVRGVAGKDGVAGKNGGINFE
ncbi:MAG TPA: hypothetical protein VFE57_01215 [Cyclobacteriaceae bacterium]|nr:hypothetical protein [Cyclobacteriaceae bacterium]